MFLIIGQYTLATPITGSAHNRDYAITFNRLINVTTRYHPAIGFVDLKYLYSLSSSGWIDVGNDPVPTATGFTLKVRSFKSANLYLARLTINYLAVS